MSRSNQQHMLVASTGTCRIGRVTWGLPWNHLFPRSLGLYATGLRLVIYTGLLIPIAPARGQEPFTVVERIRATTVAFSPEGRQLVVGGTRPDGEPLLIIVDIQSGEEVVALVGPGKTEQAAAFSPDGTALVSGNRDGTVKVWDACTGAVRVTFDAHDGEVICVAFARDGKTIASGGSDQIVKIWDLQKRQERLTLSGHQGGVLALAFSPDNSVLASGSTDKTARLWNLTTGNALRVFDAHGDWVKGLAFNARGDLLVTASGDRRVRVWDWAKGIETNIIEALSGGVWAVQITSDQKWLIAGGGHVEKDLPASGYVVIWDLKTLKEHARQKAHRLPTICLAVSSDSATYATGSYDGTVKVWSLKNLLKLRRPE